MPRALEGLDESQLAAASHPGGPLLVVAGAGTGKTRTLVARFLWLVEQGLPPDAILALTFSSSAAAWRR
jgi:DNA helicase-2/ATP-dependent DNA helicase PcrA